MATVYTMSAHYFLPKFPSWPSVDSNTLALCHDAADFLEHLHEYLSAAASKADSVLQTTTGATAGASESTSIYTESSIYVHRHHWQACTVVDGFQVYKRFII